MPEDTPIFSIIITCYNYELYVAQAIDSALAQIDSGAEVIVVNDGSKDGSWNVIASYADRITAINTKNNGFISACLTGLAASRGAYILFLDADDVLNPDALAIASQHLDEGNVSKIQYMLQPIDADGQPIGDPFPKLSPNYSNADMIKSINKVGYYPTPPTSGNIYRRDIYISLGSIKYDFGIDGVAYLVAPFKGKVVHLDQALGNYRIHGNNMSSLGATKHLKLERDKVVFNLRLEHLATLIDRGATSGQEKFVHRREYAYVLERTLFIRVLEGRHSGFANTAKYIYETIQSVSGIRKFAYIGFATVLCISPNKIARPLVEFVINPARHSRMRTLIKRAITGPKRISS